MAWRASAAWIGLLALAWAVGAGWVLLTVAFEFLAGHYLFGRPWAQLTADYDVLSGRIWPLVLVATLVAPRFVAGQRGLWSDGR